MSDGMSQNHILDDVVGWAIIVECRCMGCLVKLLAFWNEEKNYLFSLFHSFFVSL